MIQLIYNQQYLLFALISFALIFSLTFHEYGHGFVASLIGDDTAKRAGRLTLNPIPHIDPLGLFMVMAIGFGYAKPVPANPQNFNTRWGILMVAAAGPAMNLILAFIAINVYALGQRIGIDLFQGAAAFQFFTTLAGINLLLMLFNLLPLGPLDGSYMLPYVLPREIALKYQKFNRRFGTFALLGLVVLNFVGIPVFESIWELAILMMSAIQFL